MKLGFRPHRLFGGDLDRIFSFAEEIGVDCVELPAPGQAREKHLRELVEGSGLGLCSIEAMTTAMLSPDQEARRTARLDVEEAIDAAGRLGAPCVSTFAGHDPMIPFEQNIERFGEMFGPLAAKAEQAGVSVAIENCPLIGGTPPAPKNLAYCPAHWRAMFEAVPSDAIGLEFDTAHLPGLGIDLPRAIREFAGRFRHVHLKDARVEPEAMYNHSWRHPAASSHPPFGQGQINFREVIDLLQEMGYDGVVTLDLHPQNEQEPREAATMVRQLLPG